MGEREMLWFLFCWEWSRKIMISVGLCFFFRRDKLSFSWEWGEAGRKAPRDTQTDRSQDSKTGGLKLKCPSFCCLWGLHAKSASAFTLPLPELSSLSGRRPSGYLFLLHLGKMLSRVSQLWGRFRQEQKTPPWCIGPHSTSAFPRHRSHTLKQGEGGLPLRPQCTTIV